MTALAGLINIELDSVGGQTVMQKTGVGSVAELVRLAQKAGVAPA